MSGQHLNIVRSAIMLLLCCSSVPAVAALQYEYYEGTWTSVPDFGSLTPTATGVTGDFDLSLRQRDDNFAFRFTGSFTVSAAGTYRFNTESDDGSTLRVNGQLVVNNNGIHGPVTQSGSIFLPVGVHSIDVRYFDATGTHSLYVMYAPPGSEYRAFPGSGIFDGPDSLADDGQWGPVIPWPFVPVSAANLPDGRVLTWAASEKEAFHTASATSAPSPVSGTRQAT